MPVKREFGNFLKEVATGFPSKKEIGKMPGKKEYKKLLGLMGKKVLISKIYNHKHFNPETETRTWKTKELKEPRVGWVVGIRNIFSGVLKQPSYNPDEDFNSNSYLGNIITHKCLLVSFWPTEKPKRIPLDGYSIDTGDAKPFSSSWGETKKDREIALESQRDIMKKEYNTSPFPRDSKGRFIKC